MSSKLQDAINVLVERIELKAQELVENKRLVNSLCREAELEPMYPDSELAVQGRGIQSLKADHFYGKSPTTAAREYLEMRNTAVPLEEILSALERGAFNFSAIGWKEAARLKNLGISLGKNSAIFHRLPNDTIGLTKWYPTVKAKKSAAKEGPETVETQESVDEASEETTE